MGHAFYHRLISCQGAFEALVAVSHLPGITLNGDRNIVINYGYGTTNVTADSDCSSFTYSIISTALLFVAEQSKGDPYYKSRRWAKYEPSHIWVCCETPCENRSQWKRTDCQV